MENLEVRAYRWRYTVLFGMTYGLGQQIFYLLQRGHLEPWAALAVAPLVALWAALSSSERYHLRIVDGVGALGLLQSEQEARAVDRLIRDGLGAEPVPWFPGHLSQIS